MSTTRRFRESTFFVTLHGIATNHADIMFATTQATRFRSIATEVACPEDTAPCRWQEAVTESALERLAHGSSAEFVSELREWLG